MHEYGLCDDVVEAVRARAAGRPVRLVRLRVGVFHRVVDDILEHAFMHSAEGTEAEGARLEHVKVPAHGLCRDCKKEFDCFDPLDGCPTCASVDIAISGGDDLVLESLEYA